MISATFTAVLFTDIEGSSLKWLNHRAGMQVALAEHDRILRQAIEAQDGEVFKTAGDAFFAAFKRPSDAVTAAIAAQHALTAQDWSAVDGLKVRMAVHCGTAEKRGGDYFGPALNRCARLLVLGHGGQILVTAATAELLASEREVTDPTRQVGTHALDDPMQPISIHQVMVPGLAQEFPPLRAPETRPTNLPRHLTPLVGREGELTTIKEMISANRLVTLTGPGGVGKTRLVIEAGLELLPKFANGVWLVELAPLSDPNLVVSAVGTSLRLDLRGNRPPRDILISHLEPQEILIILDNCEHLVTAMAELSEALLHGTSRVRIVASSQELIGLPGEQVLRVSSLTVPDTTTPTVIEALAASAVQLFVERARAADPRFVLDARAAPAVAGICRRLDGIALAIEMAAARVPALGLEALAQGLDARFRILTGGKRTAMPRQRTLHAALDWSHSLLNEPDRVVFRRLGQFAGGFNLKAATEVVSDETIRDYEVIDCLSDLVAKSLVTADTTDAGTRYRLLETTRAYALEKLGEASETDIIARRHAEYFRELMAQCAEELYWMPTVAWRSAYAREVDNLRSALDWSFGPSGDAQTAIALAVFSFFLLDQLALYHEARTWVDLARTKLDSSTPREIEANFWGVLGASLFNGGYTPTDEAVKAFERAAELCRDLREEGTLGRVLWVLGLCRVNRGESDRAEIILAEAKPILDRSGPALFAWYHTIFGMLHALRGNLPQARKELEISVKLARGGDFLPAWDFAEIMLADYLVRLGEKEAAEKMYHDLWTRISQPPFIDLRRLLLASSGLAYVLADRGKRSEALPHLREAVAIAGKIGTIAIFSERFANIAAKTGMYEPAARLAGWSDHRVAARGLVRVARTQINRAEAEGIIRKALTAAEYDRLLAEGALMSEDEVCKLLLEA